MLSTVKRIRNEVGLSVPPWTGMLDALKWMLFARISVLFLVLFGLLTGDILGKGSVSVESLHRGLLLVSVSFLVTFIQSCFLSSSRINWALVGFQIAFDAAITSVWISWEKTDVGIFPLFYLIQILIVSLTFYQRGAILSSLIAVCFFSLVTVAKAPHDLGVWFFWTVYSAIFIVLGFVGGFLSEELRRTTENLRRKTAEVERLTEFQERIISEIPTGLLTVDNEMKLNFINPAAEHILGVLARNSVGKPLTEVSQEILPFFSQIDSQEVPEEDEKVIDPRETSVSSTGSEFHRSVFLKAKSETGGQARLQQTVEIGSGLSRRTLRGDVAEIEIDSGMGRLFQQQARGGRVLLFQDVTKIVHLEEKLKQNEKMAAIGQLAAGIAHEIRNPLASMSASIEMLKSAQEWTDPENKRLMEITLKEIDRLNGLISEFLDFVKPEKIKLSPISLDELLQEVVSAASGMAEFREAVKITTRFQKVQAMGNSEKLRQVVWNLLLNAVQAIKSKGEVQIGCETVSNQRVKWWISDTGQGMSEEVLAHIYEPFFTTKPNGTGLGLPTVYKIVEAHHGEIKVNSTLGKGTIFEIYISRA